MDIMSVFRDFKNSFKNSADINVMSAFRFNFKFLVILILLLGVLIACTIWIGESLKGLYYPGV